MKHFDGIRCDCGAILGFIPLLEIGKIILTGYYKHGHVKSPTNPFSDKELNQCNWCGKDFTNVINKLKQVERASVSQEGQ